MTPDNNLGILSGTIIAQRTLELLTVMFPALTRISTNYSDQALLFNQSVVVQIPLALEAKAWDKNKGYAPDPTDTVPMSLTINEHDHVSFGFNDQEVSSTNRNLIEEHAQTSAFALGSRLFNKVFGLLTPQNIKHENVIATADWSRRGVINQNAFLNMRGVSPFRRFGLVNSHVFAELSDDLTIVGNNTNPASNAISTGVITNVHGVEVMEWPTMPGANNLNAVFGTSQALAVATGVPKDPGSVNPGVPIPGSIELATEPNTGLTLMVREHYDMRMGFHQVTLTWMYGVGLGLPDTMERVVTAATGVAGTIVDTLA